MDALQTSTAVQQSLRATVRERESREKLNLVVVNKSSFQNKIPPQTEKVMSDFLSVVSSI